MITFSKIKLTFCKVSKAFGSRCSLTLRVSVGAIVLDWGRGNLFWEKNVILNTYQHGWMCWAMGTCTRVHQWATPSKTYGLRLAPRCDDKRASWWSGNIFSSSQKTLSRSGPNIWWSETGCQVSTPPALLANCPIRFCSIQNWITSCRCRNETVQQSGRRSMHWRLS